MILADTMPREEKVNSGIDMGMLTKLRKGSTEVLLQNDSARPHTSLKTWEQITKFGWTVLPHPPYSPVLSPSRFPSVWSPKGYSLWHEVVSLIRTVSTLLQG